MLAPIKVHTYKLFEENYNGTSETNTPNSNKKLCSYVGAALLDEDRVHTQPELAEAERSEAERFLFLHMTSSFARRFLLRIVLASSSGRSMAFFASVFGLWPPKNPRQSSSPLHRPFPSGQDELGQSLPTEGSKGALLPS